MEECLYPCCTAENKCKNKYMECVCLYKLNKKSETISLGSGKGGLVGDG